MCEFIRMASQNINLQKSMAFQEAIKDNLEINVI